MDSEGREKGAASMSATPFARVARAAAPHRHRPIWPMVYGWSRPMSQLVGRNSFHSLLVVGGQGPPGSRA
ncbi:hypothetical protein LX15_005046 [Streptoalloteichus tenebrarius]|uniref:Uncharacterized protein n=1 Tax=Streptoalloteichus tenebrarius (strain ATCC 17920 / DSM 40477 / JCM 4838 / CBS 697.72 / NBRC 16177 / NCIMB 11028 / NRRL B-12390 / A12253. 1 / ISP 5477) TaxID=1933 RepID=A0ABT1I0P4_STRSD|nr:hypothetical protein [Streptoalloteichus tenebrarius]